MIYTEEYLENVVLCIKTITGRLSIMKNRLLLFLLACLNSTPIFSANVAKKALGILGKNAKQVIAHAPQKPTFPLPKAPTVPQPPSSRWTAPTIITSSLFPKTSTPFAGTGLASTIYAPAHLRITGIPVGFQSLLQQQPASLIPFAPSFKGFGIGGGEGGSQAKVETAQPTPVGPPIKEIQGAFFDSEDEELEETPTPEQEQEEKSLTATTPQGTTLAPHCDEDVLPFGTYPNTDCAETEPLRLSEVPEPYDAQPSSEQQTLNALTLQAQSLSSEQLVDTALVVIDQAPVLNETIKEPTLSHALVTASEKPSDLIPLDTTAPTTDLVPFQEKPTALIMPPTITTQGKDTTASLTTTAQPSTLTTIVTASTAVALGAGTAAILTAKKPATAKHLVATLRTQAPATRQVIRTVAHTVTPTTRAVEKHAEQTLKTAERTQTTMIQHFKEEHRFRTDMAKFPTQPQPKTPPVRQTPRTTKEKPLIADAIEIYEKKIKVKKLNARLEAEAKQIKQNQTASQTPTTTSLLSATSGKSTVGTGTHVVRPHQAIEEVITPHRAQQAISSQAPIHIPSKVPRTIKPRYAKITTPLQSLVTHPFEQAPVQVPIVPAQEQPEEAQKPTAPTPAPEAKKRKSFLDKKKKKSLQVGAQQPAAPAAQPATEKSEPAKEKPTEEQFKDKIKDAIQEDAPQKHKKSRENDDEFDNDAKPLTKTVRRTKPAQLKQPEILPEETIDNSAPIPSQVLSSTQKAIAPLLGNSLAAARNAWASKPYVAPAQPRTELPLATTEELNAQAAKQRVLELPFGNSAEPVKKSTKTPSALDTPEKTHSIDLPTTSNIHPENGRQLAVTHDAIPAHSPLMSAPETNEHDQYPDEFPSLALKQESSAKQVFDFGKVVINTVIIQPLKHLAQYVVDTISHWFR